tara:strand:+ start:238 stop:1317 length:1080 start_codon:yes stop_codon:yes gene_type:complete
MNNIARGYSHRIKNSEDHALPHDNRPNCFGDFHEYAWADAFYNQDSKQFLAMFHADVTQSASTSPYVNFGRDEVATTFGWASNFYQRCDFIYQASTDSLEFLEWELTTANNMLMTGMTVLTKDDQGKVIKVFNGHRNLMETVIFPDHFVKGPKGKGIVSLFHKKAVKKYGLELRYPRNPAGFNAVASVSEAPYVNALRLASTKSFFDILADDVILSSSYVVDTVVGREAVSECLQLMASFYEHCTFTAQANYNNRTYLLYNGRLRNGLVVSDGFLILVRDDQGKITEVLDNPIPLHAGTLISAYLAKHHADKSFAEDFFYSDKLFQKAVDKYSLNGVHGKETRDLSSYKGFIAQFFIQV